MRRAYSAWGRGGRLPCAFNTYSTQTAGTRSPCVQYGGPGTYVSAWRSASTECPLAMAPHASLSWSRSFSISASSSRRFSHLRFSCSTLCSSSRSSCFRCSS